MDAGAGDDGGSQKGLKPGALSALLRELVATPEERQAEPPLLPGTTIGRFEIGRELCSGAFGVVYEARDRDLGRLVALKIVRPGLGARLPATASARRCGLEADASTPTIRGADRAAALGKRDVVFTIPYVDDCPGLPTSDYP